MRYMFNNKLHNVPVPTLCNDKHLLVRVQFALIPEMRNDRFSLMKTAVEKYPNIAAKLVKFLFIEGPRATFLKSRAKLETLEYRKEYQFCSISGIVDELGSDVHNLKKGDKVACFGFSYPPYTDFMLFPACLCTKVEFMEADDERIMKNASGLLYGALIIDAINWLMQSAESKEICILGLNTLGKIAVQYSLGKEYMIYCFDLKQDNYPWLQKCKSRNIVIVDSAHLPSVMKHVDGILVTSDEHSEVIVPEIVPRRLAIVYFGEKNSDDLKTSNGSIKYYRLPIPDTENVDIYSDVNLDLPQWIRSEIREEFMSQIASGKIRLEEIVESTVSTSTIKKGKSLSLDSPVFFKNEASSKEKFIKLHESHADDKFNISLIGAGDFARATLIPLIQREKGTRLRIVVDKDPYVAYKVGSKFNFEYCSTDPSFLFNDEKTDAVFIATYHDTHAPLTIEGLKAGKKVFVEKPPVVNIQQLQQLYSAYSENPGFIAVGYNRRYPLCIKRLIDIINEEEGPTTVTCMFREIDLPKTHWYYWPKEGTRIIGNMCHWIDLSYLLVGKKKPVEIVAAASVKGRFDENNSITIKFEDGSLAILISISRGDSLLGVQEFIDVRKGHISARIDDFRRMRITRLGKVIANWKGKRDKGLRTEVREVLNAMRNDTEPPIPFQDIIVTSLLMLKVIEAFENNRPLKVEDFYFQYSA